MDSFLIKDVFGTRDQILAHNEKDALKKYAVKNQLDLYNVHQLNFSKTWCMSCSRNRFFIAVPIMT